MAHDRVIILGKLDAMKGDATTGSVVALRAAVVQADDLITNGEPNNGELIHEKLEEVQEWLVDDSTSNAGAADTITNFTNGLNALI